jgi:hypothetical protein
MQDLHVWLAAAIALIVAVSGWFVRGLERWLRRRRTRARATGGTRGERRGERLLTEAGYQIMERQPRRSAAVRCGRERVSYEVRADVLVARGGRVYVAEIKSGALVADVRHGPTRRQLLEYELAFAVDGVLLVDALRDEVHEICFAFTR